MSTSSAAPSERAKPLNAQQVFDRVWNHFIVEKGPPSYREDIRRCAYRGEEGARCAAGLFIPDEEYHEGLEMHASDTKEVKPHLERMSAVASRLLSRLQAAHDVCALGENRGAGRFLPSLEIRMRDVAKKYDLTVPGGAS